MTPKLMKITPQQAKKWLSSTAVKNRNPSLYSIQVMANDMKTGNWQVTGETLIFDERENILDGQHRLMACVEADSPFESWVIFGANKSAMPYIDTGRGVRNQSDALAMKGYSSPKLLAATSKVVSLAENDMLCLYGSGIPARYRLTNSATLDLLSRHPLLPDSLPIGLVYYDGFSLVCPTVWCFLAYWLPKVSEGPGACTNFLVALSTGADLKEGSPVLALREALLKDSTAKRKLGHNDKFAMTLKAWRFFYNDKSIKTQYLRFREGEEFPDIDPRK